ncbi:hypothetical protein KEM55_007989, partial [Ascosphaera atra]
ELDSVTTRSLNILFASSALFLLSSLPIPQLGATPNIFQATRSGINTSSDLILARLARLHGGEITRAEEVLITKIRSQLGRKLYLRFGEETLLNCSFCSAESVWTYYVFWVPANAFLPHLLHFFVLGIATSTTIAGKHVRRWRLPAVVGALCLLAADLFAVLFYEPEWIRFFFTPPESIHDKLRTWRFLVFTMFDTVLAGLVYLTATNRIFPEKEDGAAMLEQYLQALTAPLFFVRAKVSAANAARASVLGSQTLLKHEYEYWTERLEKGRPPSFTVGDEVDESVWEDEEVKKALTSVDNGKAGIDSRNLNQDVERLVKYATRHA